MARLLRARPPAAAPRSAPSPFQSRTCERLTQVEQLFRPELSSYWLLVPSVFLRLPQTSTAAQPNWSYQLQHCSLCAALFQLRCEPARRPPSFYIKGPREVVNTLPCGPPSSIHLAGHVFTFPLVSAAKSSAKFSFLHHSAFVWDLVWWRKRPMTILLQARTSDLHQGFTPSVSVAFYWHQLGARNIEHCPLSGNTWSSVASAEMLYLMPASSHEAQSRLLCSFKQWPICSLHYLTHPTMSTNWISPSAGTRFWHCRSITDKSLQKHKHFLLFGPTWAPHAPEHGIQRCLAESSFFCTNRQTSSLSFLEQNQIFLTKNFDNSKHPVCTSLLLFCKKEKMWSWTKTICLSWIFLSFGARVWSLLFSSLSVHQCFKDLLNFFCERQNINLFYLSVSGETAGMLHPSLSRQRLRNCIMSRHAVAVLCNFF